MWHAITEYTKYTQHDWCHVMWKPSKHKTFIKRRSNVFDVGPTLHKCYTNVLCLLGITLILISLVVSSSHCFLARPTPLDLLRLNAGSPTGSHRLTAYKFVGYFLGLSYRKISGHNQIKNIFFRISNMLSSEVAQSLKSYGHFSDLGVRIAPSHRHVGFFG